MANLFRFAVAGIASFILFTTASCTGSSVLQLTAKDIPADTPPGVRRAIATTFASSAKDRGCAAFVLGGMKEKAVSSVPFLIRLLSDTEEAGDKPGHFVGWGNNVLVCDAASDALVSIGASVVEPLIAAVRDQSLPERLRSGAIRTLGRTCDPRALPILLAETKNRDRQITAAAVQALGDLNAKVGVKRLTEIATDSTHDEDLRCLAVNALTRLHDSQSVPVLISIIEDANADPDLRNSAAHGLIKWQDPRVTQVFVKLLSGHEHSLRQLAAEGIARRGCKEGEEILMRILGDGREEEYLRFVAARALAQSDNRKGIEKIIELVEKQRSGSLTELLMRCIAMSTDDQALDRLFLWLSQKDLADLAGLSIEYVRSSRASGRLIDVLRQRELLSHVNVAERACIALCRIKDPTVIAPLIGVFHDRQVPQFNRRMVLMTLAEFGDPRVMPVLLDAINDEDSLIQVAAVEIVGEKGDVRGIKPLAELLQKTKDESLRKKAESALAMIRGCQVD